MNHPTTFTLSSPLVGSTNANRDGARRQDVLRDHCRPGQELILVREYDNPREPCAVAVFVETPGGVQQIGSVSAKIAPEIVSCIEEGGKVCAFLAEITADPRLGERSAALAITLYPVPGGAFHLPPDPTPEEVHRSAHEPQTYIDVLLNRLSDAGEISTGLWQV